MSNIKTPAMRRSIVGAGIAMTAPDVFGQPETGRNTQAVIRTDDRVVTLVNVFTVETGAFASLLDVLRDGTETFFSKIPSFVSSSVLAARDGRRTINYPQWRSREDIAAFRLNPRLSPYLAHLRAIATLDGLKCDVALVSSV